MVPSIFEEPFGLVAIESLACATPVIGLASGALPEIINDGKTGYIVDVRAKGRQSLKETKAVSGLCDKLELVGQIDRSSCRADFEARFTADKMASEHIKTYQALTIK
jgi:glycosyltransferase involved in cell wall biosynthesis